jgi:type III pantothenate kinase
VIDGVTGLLVPPSDPAALAEALGRLLRDPPLRRKLGEAGKEFVLRSYRWEDCVIKMEALYVALVERSAGPPATAVP